MGRIILVFLICLLGVARIYGIDSMHPQKQIAYVKAKIENKEVPYFQAYQQLLVYADSIMNHSHQALADFAVPGYYDRPREHRANSLALQQDAFAAYACALAYRLSDNKKYGVKAIYFLNAWASVNKKYSEHDGVLVMSYSGSGLMMAAELMGASKIWKGKDKKDFSAWVTLVYRDACNSIRGHKNNWADWGRFGSILAGSFLGDKAGIEENIRLIKSDLFIKIAADGSMPDEVVRGNNGIWYTYFSLAPLTASCWVVYNLTGENIFAMEQSGKSIKKALDYLLYYNQHPKEWKWDTNPNVGRSNLWPFNLIEAMSGIYHDSSYADYVREQRPLFYPVHHFAWVFPTLMPVTLNSYN